jgi:hypothetical protein
MSKYRKGLPQQSGRLFLMDGGLETTLIFHDGVDLPYFAAFHLMREKEGRAALTRYYERMSATSRSRKLKEWVSFWKVRRGVPARIGAISLATPETILLLQTVMRSD